MLLHILIFLLVIFGAGILTTVYQRFLDSKKDSLGFYPTDGTDIPSHYFRKGVLEKNNKEYSIKQIYFYHWIPVFKTSYQKL